MTNAEARFNNSLRPRKPEGSLGQTAQDVHLDSHTAPELLFESTRNFFFFTRGGCVSCLRACFGARLLSQSYQYPNLSEGADRVGGQLRGDKECPLRNSIRQSLEEGAEKQWSVTTSLEAERLCLRKQDYCVYHHRLLGCDCIAAKRLNCFWPTSPWAPVSITTRQQDAYITVTHLRNILQPATVTAGTIPARTVQFKMVSMRSEKPIIMRSTLSLRSFPNVAFETVQARTDKNKF